MVLGSAGKVVLVPEVLKQSEAWLEQIRARIAHWELLQQRVREFAVQHQSIDFEQVAKGIDGIIVDNPAALPDTSSSETNNETKRATNLGNLPERMQKLSLMFKQRRQFKPLLHW